MKRLVLLVLLAAGCGLDPPPPEPDFFVDGIGVAFDVSTGPMPAWASSPDFPDRFLAAVDASARYWGGQGHGDLRGWVVVFRAGDRVDCGGMAVGCQWDSGWLDIATAGTQGVEQTVLIHEVGHAELLTLDPHGGGDPCHSDRRWNDFRPVAWELESQGRDARPEYWRRRPGC